MVFTEAAPSFTLTWVAPLPSGSHLKQTYRGIGLPEHRPANVDHIRQTFQFHRAVDAQFRTGAGGSGPSSFKSTITVPFWAAGSIRITCPGTMPFRVSISAGWLSAMSFICVSAIFSSAFNFVGSATFARMVTGRDALAHFNVHFLQTAVNSRANRQLVHLFLFQIHIRRGPNPPQLAARRPEP